MRLFIFLLYVLIVYSIQTSSESLTDEEQNTVQQKLLNDHNKYRKLHNVNPLVLDEDFCEQAKACATALAGGENEYCFMQDDWGLNTWRSSQKNLQAMLNFGDTDPVGTWYAEGKNYPGFYLEKFPKYVDNFTQLVWKSSKELGCGFDAIDQLVVACHYRPKGNVRKAKNLNATVTNYALNVLPALPELTNDESGSISTYWWYILGILALALVAFIVWLTSATSPKNDESDFPSEYDSGSPPEYDPDSFPEDVSDSPPDYE